MPRIEDRICSAGTVPGAVNLYHLEELYVTLSEHVDEHPCVQHRRCFQEFAALVLQDKLRLGTGRTLYCAKLCW